MTSHAGSGAGEIGGIVTRSRTPAWYGMKIAPLSFDDAFSASGRLVVMPSAKFGGACFGFFNSARQEWRPWSSMAVRLRDLHAGPAAGGGESCRLHVCRLEGGRLFDRAYS